MNILIDMPVFHPHLDFLKQMKGVNIDVIESPEELSRDLPVSRIKDCDIIFCTHLPKNHPEMNKLKYIQISSSGYSQLAGLELSQRGIVACNALGVFDVPIAEWNLAMMINLKRDLRSLIRNQDHQVWDRAAKFQSEVRGSVVGIWGYGGIGRETARLAKAFEMKVHVMTRSGVKARKNTYCVPGTGDPDGILPDNVFYPHEKNEFLRGLDFLIMTIPQTSTTTGIIGEPELKNLQPGAFLLNPARGPLIQEEALLKALREKWIAGAALDTHYYYPLPPDHPLWQMPNVILTPHISGSTASTYYLQRVWDIFKLNVINFQNGSPLLNTLSAEQLSE